MDSSFMSVALVTFFKSAMAGTCKGHEELASSALPLEAWLPAVPARGGEPLVRRLFEPLGYELEVTPIALDPSFPEWGEGRHVALRLAGERRLAELLSHLYVLLPVLDDEKHYWVDEAEIDKLMRRGEGWLGGHPERDLITRRYLKNQASLFYPALARIDEDTPATAPGEPERERPGGPRFPAGAAPPRVPGPHPNRPPPLPGHPRVRPRDRGPGAPHPPRAPLPRARVRLRCPRNGERARRSAPLVIQPEGLGLLATVPL